MVKTTRQFKHSKKDIVEACGFTEQELGELIDRDLKLLDEFGAGTSKLIEARVKNFTTLEMELIHYADFTQRRSAFKEFTTVVNFEDYY